jgi:gas vesicle protein
MNNERIYYSHDAEMTALRDRTLLALVFLTFGLGIGAALALLFAPAAGTTTRHNIAKNVEEGLQRGRENVEPVMKRLEEELAKVRENVEERVK